MISHLKLAPGDSLIDIGCGYGDWLNYAKSKGIQVTGINMSLDQAAVVKALHGIEVVCTNWKNILKDPLLQNKLYGKFDAVTFMGSIEHFAPIKYWKNEKKQAEVYSDMFKMANHLLKPDSQSSRVLISCLHDVKPNKSFAEYIRGYFFDKYYSGLYPFGDDGLTKFSHHYFQELSREDKTEDYRIATVLDPDHFAQYRIRWNLRKIWYSILLFILDPCYLHKWVEIKWNSWMYLQFGKDAWEMSYAKPHQKEQRCVTLWWILLQKKNQKVGSKDRFSKLSFP